MEEWTFSEMIDDGCLLISFFFFFFILLLKKVARRCIRVEEELNAMQHKLTP